MLEWTGRETTDPETFSRVLQAKVGGQSVSVYISREAVEDRGLDACKEIAERKIADACVGGMPPNKVNVTTSDFGG